MSGSIKLNNAQLDYVLRVTGIADRQQAIEYFAELMIKERIDTSKMSLYISKMMKKESEKK